MIWIFAALVGLLTAIVLTTQGMNGLGARSTVQAEAESDAAIPVELAPVLVGSLNDTATAVGTLEANEAIIIRPEISGIVTAVRFVNGQTVTQGTVLIELDDAELQAQAAQAAAQLKIARLTYDRMKRLLENRNTVVSPQQVDQARSELQSADAAHTVYLTRLRKTRIVAPFSGTLGIRRFSPGDYVQPGQDLVNLEDVRTINVDCKVPEAFLSRVAVGQTVQVMTDAYPGEVFTGEIAALDPRIDAVNRAVRVRARVPNAQGKLGPGLFATVRLILGIAGDQKKLGFTIHALLREEDRYTLTVTRNRKSVRPSRGIHDICV
jgi:membrane fusion protein, multidrug efflux system